MSTSDAPQWRASLRMCARIVSSYGECSSGTRMRLYMALLPSSGPEPAHALHEQPRIQRGDHYGHAVRQELQPAAIDECAHLRALRGESHQWEHRERELQAQNHLTQHEQLRRPALAVQDSRHD